MKAPKIGNGPINIPPAAFVFGLFKKDEEVKTKIKPIKIKNKPILSKFSILHQWLCN